MTTSDLAALADLARRDAAVQERVVAALREPDAARALLALAAEMGLHLSGADLPAPLAQPLEDSELDPVRGGLSSPLEMFAEFRSLGSPRKVEGH